MTPMRLIGIIRTFNYPLKFGQHKHINFQYKISSSLQTYEETKNHIPLSVLSVILKFSGQKAFDETILAPSFMLANLNFSCNINQNYSFMKYTCPFFTNLRFVLYLQLEYIILGCVC